jgi:DNA-binding transcriptional MerR regulator
MDSVELKPYLRVLHDQGISLKAEIEAFLDSWPIKEDNREGKFEDLSTEKRTEVDALITSIRKWFNLLKSQILPHLLYDQTYLYYLLRRVEACIKKMSYKRPYPESMPSTIILQESKIRGLMASLDDRKSDIEVYSSLKDAKNDAAAAMITAISLIESVPEDALPLQSRQSVDVPHYNPNSAFILMWMDPNHHELDDVCNAIKDVCRDYGIQALRADDIQHEDKITDLVLANIAQSEFLIADLTGERPNVYYEIGYAHALGKRPILYRKEGTSLHFDLSVHNVPEYKNITELKQLLKKRFDAILGRTPNG